MGNRECASISSDAEIPDLTDKILVISTSATLYRPLDFKPKALVVAGLEDQLRRHSLDGPERAAEVIARFAGLYGDNAVELIVAAEQPEFAFYDWLKGVNQNYFSERYALRRSRGLPPFAPVHSIRIRARNLEHAMKFVSVINQILPGFVVGELASAQGQSVRCKVYEAEIRVTDGILDRKHIAEAARSTKVEAVAWAVFH
ncbi:MAG: hypothetical protein HRF49_11650 [bacterium]